MGYVRAPNKLHVYDAGYIKLREASLTYNFSAETLGKLPFTTASLQSLEEIYGLSIRTSADPEAGLSSEMFKVINLVLILLLEKLEQVLNYSFKK
jgi:hypothetical protein